ncbi:TrmH family RNA methyltransferase [Bacteroidetes bacterium endosymbiont of Geopemphigus sp.]|uniref:TrmH family RNA methyltransferase n=1 Tax=Bacteroidetes bacterium endosymbiont of Geopemphigus sp. TaxID=2047937 RepID=UPI000CD1F081|nr:RNA methyltransferase [Bacteroidetes bacterium endosymbiont of Geopemphigus sp.]
MITKSQKQLIKSLRHKKYRELNGLFVIEGLKCVQEAIKNDLPLTQIFCTDKFFDYFKKQTELTVFISEKEMEQISFLTHFSGALALCRLSDSLPIPISGEPKHWNLVLDEISDPGNLGSILRLADWFALPTLWISKNTVDVYNPKVIQSSMGSFSRVRVFYTDLDKVLSQTHLPIWGASLEGDNIYHQSFPESGWLIMGNESRGISPGLQRYISKRVSIPRFHPKSTVESLNVAMATSVFLSELRRCIFTR